MTTAIKDRRSSPGVGPVLAAAVLGFLLGIALASAVHVVGQGGGRATAPNRPQTALTIAAEQANERHR